MNTIEQKIKLKQMKSYANSSGNSDDTKFWVKLDLYYSAVLK